MTSTFLPSLFLVGAAKSGTTTIHKYLSGLDGVCMSKPKEPFFFEATYENGLDYYQRTYFAHWNGEQLIGESRHRNLYLPYVPQRIYETNPDAKIIAILRDPVTRAYSHWFHNFSRLSEPLSFRKAILEDMKRINKGLRCDTQAEIEAHIKNLPRKWDGGVFGLGLYRTYVDSGYYLEQLQRYYQLFPKENIHVIIFENLKTDYKKVITELGQFLDLDLDTNTQIAEKWENKKNAKNYHKRWEKWLWKQFPTLDPYRFPDDFKKFLYAHFQDRNRELAEFLNIDLEIWNGK